MKFTQIGRPIIMVCIIVEMTLIGFMLFYAEKPSHELMFGFSTFLLVFLIFFYKLEVKVSDTKLVIAFGIGLIRKTIPIHSLQEARPAKSSVAGSGQISNYMLYSLGGVDCVEILFKDKLKSIRVGSDAPTQLSDFLNSRIQK
ncbi:hypothetical protein SanaruYs_25390 [Chryseotalea sanaruensis]|uniref:PH domain-containing protein n=1 Tax=Chryseotalea sanaruensis TaxID=2482724 RepID=A0A401UBL9_9BACT|nr:hypothetical protein [Chryseotalea sanaruensis]GCC52303.1 hypothetical protein SanaruYs_25390 [Chryseotalea sanaruensis]